MWASIVHIKIFVGQSWQILTLFNNILQILNEFCLASFTIQQVQHANIIISVFIAYIVKMLNKITIILLYCFLKLNPRYHPVAIFEFPMQGNSASNLYKWIIILFYMKYKLSFCVICCFCILISSSFRFCRRRS